MELISVIVPVYNIEKYLVDCIESILNQTYENFELILIDDGSTDLSAQICDEYYERDSRVKVCHKKNGGLSSARNRGLDIASGEYLTFVDGDDCIEQSFLQKAIDQIRITNAEIVILDYLRFQDNTIIKQPKDKEKKVDYISGKQACKFLYGEEGVRFTTACMKVYNKHMWENIRFPVGKIHEDEYTTYKVLYNSKNICLINEPLYFYRKTSGSITEKNFSVARYDIIGAYDERMEFFDEKDESGLYNSTKRRRDICNARYYLLAKKNKIINQIPKKYKINTIKAVCILKSEFSEDEFEYFLYQCFPKITRMYCVIKKLFRRKDRN